MNIRQHPDPFRSQNHYVIPPPLLGHLFGPPSPPAAAHLRQRLLGELKLIWPAPRLAAMVEICSFPRMIFAELLLIANHSSLNSHYHVVVAHTAHNYSPIEHH